MSAKKEKEIKNNKIAEHSSDEVLHKAIKNNKKTKSKKIIMASALALTAGALIITPIVVFNKKFERYEVSIFSEAEEFQSYRFMIEKGSTIFDVLDKMAEKYDFEYDEEQYGYISGIQSLDGVWLYEMDNGDYSGWMYRVNDKLVSSGVREYKLKNGDNIIWYYTDNYTLEKETKKFSDSSYEKQNNEEVKEPKVENKIIKFNGDSSLIDNIFVKVTDEDGNEVILWNVIYDEEIGGFKIEADVNSKVELCTFEVKPSEENISHWGYSATMFCLARKIISCELNDMNKYITSNDIKNVQVLFGVEEPINEKSNVTREEMIFELAKCIDSSSSMVIIFSIRLAT